MIHMWNIFFACFLVLTITDKKALSQTKKITDKLKLFRGNNTKHSIEDIEKDEDLQYPGQNKKLFQAIQGKWNDYYKCLELRENEIKKPELCRLIEGQNIVFECGTCIRPFQNYEELQWYYKPLSPDANVTELEPLDLAPEMELLPNKTLKMFNVVKYFEGLYVCSHGRDPVTAFILEISSNDTIERVPSTYERMNKNTLILNDTEFKIEYKWGKWSECSVCGAIGRKYRYSTCFVSPKYSDDLVQNNIIPKAKNITRKMTHIFNKLKSLTSEDNENFDWGVEIITKFSNGVPCASPYLPKAAIQQIKNYKPAKAIVKFCQETCQETEIFAVEDRYGKIIEMANNSAGIYSMLQKLPHLPPEIVRVSVTEELGKDIIIQCPGTSLTNTPVTWAMNKKTIFPEVIAEQSNGRFEIDLVNRINLKKLRLKDSHTYSCWQKSKLVGTVHLKVEKKLKFSFNHHVTLVGVAAVIGTFLFVGAKVLTRALNSRRMK